MNSIKYRGGYKYQLAEDYSLETGIRAHKLIDAEYIQMWPDGRLVIKEGYAWDGPSGPALDTRNFMRGSLVHDALYQLMREGRLDHADYRGQADRALRAICLEDGMSSVRAWWVYVGVRWGAGPAAEPINNRPILVAP